MDPLSTHIIICSEASVHTQPHQPPANNITRMDDALYKAAAQGKIEEFSNYQGSRLMSLLTPSQNTALHVHLAAYDPFDVLGFKKQFCHDVILFCLWSMKTIDTQRFYGEKLRKLGRSWIPKKNLKFIEQILSKCPSLLVQPNAKGQTPLHIAASRGHSDAVKFLISYQAKARQEDPEKQRTESVREMLRKTDLESNTALHLAAQHGHLQVVKELLAFEDPDILYPVNRNQETPLYTAARGGYSSLVAEISDKFKSAALPGPHGRTVLHAAAMSGHADTTRIILEKRESLAKETDENGQTPLHYAAHLDHSSVVKELLKRDKSAAYIGDKKWGMTPLLMAARQGCPRTTREIIYSCPGCCELVDTRGWNLLHFAALRQGLYELRVFLKLGDSLRDFATPPAAIRDLKDEKDALGITPLQVFHAYKKYASQERLSGEKNQPTKQMEQILKISEEIAKEKQLTAAPVCPIRDEKDGLPTQDKMERILKLSEEIVKEKQVTADKKEIVSIAELLEGIMNDKVAEKPVHLIRVHNPWINFEPIKDRKNADLLVATLIATVTFSAGIAVPGGYKSDKGPDQGTPFLIRDTAFKAFVIADSLAFLFSLFAIGIQYSASFPYSQNLRVSLNYTTTLIKWALAAFVIAFSTGTYAVLQPFPLLAVSALSMDVILSFFAYCAIIILNWVHCLHST